MKKNGLFSVVKWVGFVLLLALLVSCPGSPDIEDGDGPPLEEDFLKGQWAVYEEGVETPYIIDIQHTLPDYWIMIYTSEDSTLGEPVKSDRKGPDKDGWFEVTDHSDKIRYKFADNDRDTLEVELRTDDVPDPYILKRIPREDEIIMHIVSFKLDDSIESAGYTLPGELVAVKDGTPVSKGLPILIGPGETAVPAKYTMEDDKEVTKETIVNEDITVIVAPAVGD